MSKRLLFNTDVLTDYLRGDPDAVAYLESRTETLLVSAVTVTQLPAGVRERQERATLEAFLEAFEVIAVDQAIARQGTILRRDYAKSHGTSLFDALIAATAALQQATLVTRNRKHFPMLKEVLVPYQK